MDEQIESFWINHQVRYKRFMEFVNDNKKDYNVSLHLYDLGELSNYRPSMSIWKKCLKDKIDTEIESELFELILHYVLGSGLDKFTSGVEILLSDVESYLHSKYYSDFTMDNITKKEVQEYITELSGCVNKITMNILNGLQHMDRIIIYRNNLTDVLRTTSIGFYLVDEINIDIRNDTVNNFTGFLELFIVTKRDKYGL